MQLNPMDLLYGLLPESNGFTLRIITGIRRIYLTNYYRIPTDLLYRLLPESAGFTWRIITGILRIYFTDYYWNAVFR